MRFVRPPGMNPSDVQSDAEPTYFDPEEIDMSEQQFAASLEISVDKPRFEIDEADGRSEDIRPPIVEDLGAESLTADAHDAELKPASVIVSHERHDAAASSLSSAPP